MEAKRNRITATEMILVSQREEQIRMGYRKKLEQTKRNEIKNYIGQNFEV
jgi:hypothetical protein